MPVTIVPFPKMPLDQGMFPVQVLGSMLPNKDGSVVAGRIVLLNPNTNDVTLMTQATNPAPANDIVFLLRAYHVYEMRQFNNALGVATSFVQLCFGNGTDPVSGDFKALPAAGAGVQGGGWELFSDLVYTFSALPGQERLALKNMGAVGATTYVAIRELC